MNWYTVIALAVGPGLFWLWFFYKKDKWEPEPKSLVLRLFILGMLITIPVLIAEEMADSLLRVFSPTLILVFGAPVIEELGKYWVVRRFIFDNVEFDEPMDGIVYAAAAALGFATVENIGYVGATYMGSLLSDPVLSKTGAVIGISITRAIFSVPGHVLFSISWGYALGVAKFMHNPAKGNALVRWGLLLAIGVHGIFNAAIGVPYAALFLLIVMTIAWRMASRRIAIALVTSPHIRSYPAIKRIASE